jgi:hypothetical protein
MNPPHSSNNSGALSDSAFAALGDSDATRLDELRQAKEQVEHLFRYSLQRNHINPLMHLVWRYRRQDIVEASDVVG